jgi:predicted DNA-binding transcriptional regulator YafY
MRFWALQYGPYVEVLSPADLREKIKADIDGMMKKYSYSKE